MSVIFIIIRQRCLSNNMHKITKSKIEKLFIVNPEAGKVYWKIDRKKMKAGEEAGHISQSGYWKISTGGKTYLRSRIIYIYVYGKSPKVIDHKDLNRSNDKISNLRAVSYAQNSANRDDVLGYSYHSKSDKYQARILLGGKFKSLGYYKDPRAASLAYLEERIKTCAIELEAVTAKRDALRKILLAEGVIV